MSSEQTIVDHRLECYSRGGQALRLRRIGTLRNLAAVTIGTILILGESCFTRLRAQEPVVEASAASVAPPLQGARAFGSQVNESMRFGVSARELYERIEPALVEVLWGGSNSRINTMGFKVDSDGIYTTVLPDGVSKQAGVVGGIPFILVLKSGDLGSALVWAPVIGAMLLVGAIPFRYLIVIVLSGTLILPFAYFFGLKDYQKKRITVQIDMLMGREVDIRNEAYSAHNNLMAIGSGGWAGKGFKNPDTLNYKGFISKDTAITDFIFPVLAEEHGFRGAFLMLSAFLLLLLQSLFVAFYSKDMTGRLLVVGVVALFFAHIFQNVGMNLLLMPITGIPLPLISYGGTFMVMVLFLLGLVQSVWVHRRSSQPGQEASSGMQIDHLA